MLHQLKVLAGVVVESKGKRPLSEMRPGKHVLCKYPSNMVLQQFIY